MTQNIAQPVAVIMTLYRADPLDAFELALSSLENQTLEATIRVYLCVDGPLPESHEVWLEQNATRFHKVLRNETNLGLARSLNRLIDLLEDEEFVFRMDGDDISLPSRFERQIELMCAEPDLGLCGCQAIDIDDDGKELAPRKFPVTPEETRHRLSRITPVLHPTFCIRRTILRNPKMRYPDAYLCEDLAFLVTLTGAGHSISNHPETLFKWRTGKNFFKRRQDARRGWVEMSWYFRALRANGRLFSPQAVFPVLRFIMRILPQSWIVWLYGSPLRNFVIGKDAKQKSFPT
jgi:Predicted glycosyltransferases